MALCAIMDLWGATGPGTDYSARQMSLSGLLNALTVHDDGVEDKLEGGPGLDWFFANVSGAGVKDKVTGTKPGETVTDL